MTKKRILFVSEASFLATGFASYYKELITRIHETKKYEIAELACAALIEDPRDNVTKWKVYPNEVFQTDPRYEHFKSSESNKMGKWRFDTVLLDFRPDIVVDLRDPPFFAYQQLSSLRQFFNWIIAPTVDSFPQTESWLDIFNDADYVLPYTDFGSQTIKDACPKANVKEGFYPGVNLSTYRHLNQAQVRAKHGIDADAKIVGFVARNQVRKLIPDLLKSFRDHLDSSNDKNKYLLLHTAFPDRKPWNIPKLLLESGLQDKVLFTYLCHKCKGYFVSVWQGPTTCCRHCHEFSAEHPRTGNGLPADAMSEIYSLMDLYVQPASREGLGIPVLEAAACKKYFGATDYAALENLNTLLGGFRLKASKLSRDINVDAYRAEINTNDLTSFLGHLDLPREILSKKGAEVYQKLKDRFCWDKVAKKWEELFDNVVLTGNQGKWFNSRLEPEFDPIVQPSSISEFVKAGLTRAGRPELFNTHFGKSLITGLYYNKYLPGSPDKLTKEQVENVLQNLQREFAHFEKIRIGEARLEPEDYLQFAETKMLAEL